MQRNESLLPKVLERVKLSARRNSLVSGLAVGGKLNDKHRDAQEQENMYEAIPVKKEFENKPKNDKSRAQYPQHFSVQPLVPCRCCGALWQVHCLQPPSIKGPFPAMIKEDHAQGASFSL